MDDAVENMDNHNSIDTSDMIDKKEPLDTIEVNDNDSSVIKKKRKESTNFTLQEGVVIKEDDNENFDLETNYLEDDSFDSDDDVSKVRKKHFCQICNRSFRDSWKLKRHEKVHTKADELSEPTDFPLKEGMKIKKEFQNEKPIDTHNDLAKKSAQFINQPLSDSLNRKKSSNMSGTIIQRGEN